MYKIIRKGKRFNNKTFTTYEEARSYIRKWIRTKFQEKHKYNNPSISKFNFSIAAI